MNIKVRKLTDVELLREMAEMTTGQSCEMSLLTAYRNLHSLVRTQIFVIKLYDIPSSVMGHLVRHVHAQPYVLSKRPDRGGEDFIDVCSNIAFNINTAWIFKDAPHIDDKDVPRLARELDQCAKNVMELPCKFDRNKPVNVALLLNAEEIISISRARLCSKAAKETRDIWRKTLELIEEIDPDLVRFCKRPCVMAGLCRESKPCGYMSSDTYRFERKVYKELFKPKV